MNTAGLVIALTRMGLGTRRPALPRLDARINWRAVLTLATAHRVAPLVAQALAIMPSGTVPDQILDAFEEQLWRSRAAHLLCEHLLCTLLGTLAAQGIEVLVLKGAALAHELYPCPELRPYHDIDLLCRPADYACLWRALLALGYRTDEPIEASARMPRFESICRRNFFAPDGDVELEVHLDVLGLGLPERHRHAFWREARIVDAGTLRIPTLAPMHQLLHLAVHAHAHCYSRLLWLCDIDSLVRTHAHSLDWELAMWVARDEGVGAVPRHALATAGALLGTPCPPLPPATLEEALLGPCYRRLWPQARVVRLERKEHRRLLRFHPGTGDLRDVLYGLILTGRRWEKCRSLVRPAW